MFLFKNLLFFNIKILNNIVLNIFVNLFSFFINKEKSFKFFILNIYKNLNYFLFDLILNLRSEYLLFP